MPLATHPEPDPYLASVRLMDDAWETLETIGSQLSLLADVLCSVKADELTLTPRSQHGLYQTFEDLSLRHQAAMDQPAPAACLDVHVSTAPAM